MGINSIFRGFGAILLILAFAMVAPLMLSVWGGDGKSDAYLFAIAVSAVAGAGFIGISGNKKQFSDLRGALIIVLFWWVIAPLFAALPMWLGGMTFGDSYFDAIAAITTTGGWLDRGAAELIAADMLWRALLQWLGGFASIAIAAAIFIRPAFIGIDTLLPPFSSGESGGYLRPLRNAVRSFAPIYLIITGIAYIGLLVADTPPLQAIVMATSGIASGGFWPGFETGLTTSTPMIIIMFALMILSASNFVVIARLVHRRRVRAVDIENGSYVLILLAAAFLFWLLAGAGDVDLLIPQAFNAVSIMSTNGLTIGEAPPLSIALVTAIIGGAAVSTAGGFKILRWLVIMGRGYEELRRLVEPSAVFGASRVANELGVWIHFLVFTMTLGALVVVLAMGGAPFELAAAAAVSALANAGPLIYLAEGGAGGYAVIDGLARWALVAGMVLGRLEGAVALALFSRWFWRV